MDKNNQELKEREKKLCHDAAKKGLVIRKERKLAYSDVPDEYVNNYAVINKESGETVFGYCVYRKGVAQYTTIERAEDFVKNCIIIPIVQSDNKPPAPKTINVEIVDIDNYNSSNNNQDIVIIPCSTD